MLTKRQELFAQNLFSGMTQRESWIKAGYSSNYPLEMVDIHACQLANSDKVKIRLNELNDKVVSPLIATEIERKEILSTISRTALKQVKARDNIAAIQELNRMEKLYDTGAIHYTGIKILVVRAGPDMPLIEAT